MYHLLRGMMLLQTSLLGQHRAMIDNKLKASNTTGSGDGIVDETETQAH